MIIKNTGEGIPPEHLEKIFERFYRVDSSRDRETGGYGLGLSIANSIVKQHKGKIYAQSKINEYASFIVEFPQQSL
jgi:signal transduction histidine kinase